MFEKIMTTVITVLVGAIVGAFIKHCADKRRDHKLLPRRIAELEKWRCFVQQDIASSSEERRIVLRAVLACLYGLQEQGCNGPVTNGINMLEKYLDDQAHKTKSYTNEKEKEL